MLKLSRNINEICYPFIQESSYLCDFEVITDELCTMIGMIFHDLDNNLQDIAADLETIQPLAFHINGSIRGRLAISEDDLAFVESRYIHYRKEVGNIGHDFVLPRGAPPLAQLHSCRSSAKKAIRAMVRIDEQGIAISPLLPRLCNLLCNYFFICTLVINQRRGIKEIGFKSASYGKIE